MPTLEEKLLPLVGLISTIAQSGDLIGKCRSCWHRLIGGKNALLKSSSCRFPVQLVRISAGLPTQTPSKRSDSMYVYMYSYVH